MFYILDNEKIVLFSEDKKMLENTLVFMPQYQCFEILETDKKIVEFNGEFYFEDDETYLELSGAKEKERIAQLNMTRGDFIEGLILAQGKDEKDIIALIEALPITDVEKKVYINRVNNALDFYRGYPVIDVLCGYLNVTTENMTKFFETKDYTYLKPVEDVINPDEPIEETTVTDEVTDVEDVNNVEE